MTKVLSKERFDFSGVAARISTWLGILTLAQGGAVIAYGQAPQEWKDSLPDLVGGWLLIGMMVTGALTPIATSFKQKRLTKPPPAGAGYQPTHRGNPQPPGPE